MTLPRWPEPGPGASISLAARGFGLIDNHMHLLRAGTTWQNEVRLDGVESRKAALDRLRARAKTTPRGDWIYTLGGWAIEQFADDTTPFSRAELDRAVPDLAVLDRDYLTVPADQIKDITSVMTIVGGRVVHEEGLKGASVVSETRPWPTRDVCDIRLLPALTGSSLDRKGSTTGSWRIRPSTSRLSTANSIRS